jgi:glucose-6-phosphate 1-dehydrogenase
MSATDKLPPTVLVLFGTGGDLVWRKLVPALFDLFRKAQLPDQFAMIGVGRSRTSDEQLRRHLRRGVDRFSHGGRSNAPDWKVFAAGIR